MIYLAPPGTITLPACDVSRYSLAMMVKPLKSCLLPSSTVVTLISSLRSLEVMLLWRCIWGVEFTLVTHATDVAVHDMDLINII